MTNRELSASIKKEIKANGIDPRAVRVSVKDSMYDTTVRVKILSPEISCEAVKKILARFHEVDYDAATGELLAGGNTYLFIRYEDGIFDTVAQEYEETAQRALESPDEITEIMEGLYLIKRGYTHEIRQQNAAANINYAIYDAKTAAKYIYKFIRFGSIAA